MCCIVSGTQADRQCGKTLSHILDNTTTAFLLISFLAGILQRAGLHVFIVGCSWNNLTDAEWVGLMQELLCSAKQTRSYWLLICDQLTKRCIIYESKKNMGCCTVWRTQANLVFFSAGGGQYDHCSTFNLQLAWSEYCYMMGGWKEKVIQQLVAAATLLPMSYAAAPKKFHTLAKRWGNFWFWSTRKSNFWFWSKR